MGAFEAHGTWWLPGHDDHKVPGVLSWDDTAGGRLQLVGQLRPVVVLDNELADGRVQKYRVHAGDDDRTYPVVLGQVEHQAYTLRNAFQTSWRDWSLDQSTETVHANAVFEGVWFDGPDIEVDRARFQMRDLAGWVDASGLEVTYPRLDGAGEEFAVLMARSLPNLDIPYADAKVWFGQSLTTTRRGTEAIGIEQDWTLCIDADAVAPLQSFVEVASDVQDLVSIATGRTSEFRDVVVQHPDVPRVPDAGTLSDRRRRPLKYHAQWTNRADFDAEGKEAREPMDARMMYFNLGHLGVDGLGRWLDVAARFRTELGRAMATRYGREYLEDRIMNVCAALDSFDRHHRGTKGKVDYVKRIDACVALAGPEFGDLIVEDPTVWARRVLNVRNDLAHHRDRFRLDGSVGGHLVSEQLFWLFALCMLRVAQAPDAVFGSITNHRHSGWLRDQAQKGLAPQDQ